MTLEEQITEGEVALIVGLVHDPQEQALTIDFARAYEPYAVFGTLRFLAVSNYSFEINFEEDRQDFEAGVLMEDMLGLRDMGVDANPNFIINTAVREIWFNATASTWTLI